MKYAGINEKKSPNIISFFKDIKARELNEKKEIDMWISTLNNKEKDKAQAILSVVKSGRFILMLGALCPLFWKSLFSGDGMSVLLFNLGHSILYIAIGYSMIKKSKKSLKAMKAMKVN